MAFTSEASVAIVLVNWNGLEFTLSCLASLKKVDYPKFKVILVDNGSENHEGMKIQKAFPEIHLIQSQKNLGFAGGNNLGIRFALEQEFSHVLLLNNDTEVTPDFLGEMIRQLSENPRLGVIQPLILFLHDKKILWSAGGKFVPWLGRAITLGNQKPMAHYPTRRNELDWATGCCFLITREALLKSGLLNESYFTYFEDVEWSLRIKKSGFGIGLADKARIYHVAGASSKTKHAEGTLSPRVFYYHVRNQFFLLRQAHIPWGFPYHFSRFLLWSGYFLVRGRLQKLGVVLSGIKDGLFQSIKPAERWP
jgi:GT2 family glycosyltransferase